MTSERYLRRCMLLPFVLPVLARIVPASVPDAYLPRAGELLLGAAWMIATAGVFGFVPYMLFVALARVWRPRTAFQLRRLAWLAPTLIALPASMVVNALFWRAQAAVALRRLPVGIGLARVIGYGYVALVELGLRLGRVRGLIQDPARFDAHALP